jgi:hypothetical protein
MSLEVRKPKESVVEQQPLSIFGGVCGSGLIYTAALLVVEERWW